MQTSTPLMILGLFLCCILLASQAEAGCWYEFGKIQVCNWENIEEDVQKPVEYIREEVVDPLIRTIESLIGACADSHNDRKERLMASPRIHMIHPEMPQGQPVYFVNGVGKTFSAAQVDGTKLSEAIRQPVGLIHNPTVFEGDTGTPHVILRAVESAVEPLVSISPFLSAFLDDGKETLYDRAWPNLFPNGCQTQFNPTTQQVTGLLYEAAEANAGPITIVSHSQGNIIVRNGIMGAMHLGKEGWIRNNLTWIITAPPITHAEINMARWKEHREYLVEQDCIGLFRSWGGGACEWEAHDFVGTYIPRIKDDVHEIIADNLPKEQLMSLRTRRGAYFNAYDSTGPVSAGHVQPHPDPLVSDEIFRLIDLNGETLESGDPVVIRTRRGTYFNAWGSSGDVSASRVAYHPDPTVSDEIFTLIKVKREESEDTTIRNGDHVVLQTRSRHYFNAYNSSGKVSASRDDYHRDPTVSDEIFTILLGEATHRPAPHEQLMSLRTRYHTYFNAWDSTGPVSAGHLHAHPDPTASDEIFRLIDLNGAPLESGDLVVVRTRRGHYFNAYDSSGEVKASALSYPPDLHISDEIFTLLKVGGSAGNTIRNEDRVVIQTRSGHYFNAYGSRGKVSASRLDFHRDPTVSDEIFTILLGEAIAHRAEIYRQLKALYQAVLGRAMDDDGWQHYSTLLLDSGWTLGQVRDVIAHSAEAYGYLAGIYQAVLGRAMDGTGRQGYANALANGWTLSQVRNDIAHSAEAYGCLAGIYQAVLGRAMDDSGKQTYSNALANGWTLEQVRGAIAQSSEAQNGLATAYQAIWGRPIGQDDLAHYTFLLGLPDWTLADIIQDEQERYLQTVVLPVLIAVSVVLQ